MIVPIVGVPFNLSPIPTNELHVCGTHIVLVVALGFLNLQVESVSVGGAAVDVTPTTKGSYGARHVFPDCDCVVVFVHKGGGTAAEESNSVEACVVHDAVLPLNLELKGSHKLAL